MHIEKSGIARGAIFFVPGANGKPLSDVISQAIVGAGYDILNHSFWNSPQELEEKSLADIQADIVAAAEYLHKQGYGRIVAMGKSLGGGFLLTHKLDVQAMVLLAPAIGVAEEENIEEVKTRKLSSISKYSDLNVSHEMLRNIELPVLVIRGATDNVVSEALIEEFCSHLPRAKCVMLLGADHSFKTSQGELATHIIDFLKNSV